MSERERPAPRLPAVGESIVIERRKYRIARMDDRSIALVLLVTDSPARRVTHQLTAAADALAWTPLQGFWRIVGKAQLQEVRTPLGFIGGAS